jgi:hypothetical protein
MEEEALSRSDKEEDLLKAHGGAGNTKVKRLGEASAGGRCMKEEDLWRRRNHSKHTWGRVKTKGKRWGQALATH